jgi:predicted transcriptional regulator
MKRLELVFLIAVRRFSDTDGAAASVIAAELHRPPRATARYLDLLVHRGLLTRTQAGYRLTDEGHEAIDSAKMHPSLQAAGAKWASLVRQGIDHRGRQTRVTKAAIPSTKPDWRDEPTDIEDLIDLKRNLERRGLWDQELWEVL